MMDRFGTEAQKQEWTEALITGERSMAFRTDRAEPRLRRHLAGDRAEADGDGWVIKRRQAVPAPACTGPPMT
jgi:alkylation response protein AidB-like acyl-CoA dehydrogenase